MSVHYELSSEECVTGSRSVAVRKRSTWVIVAIGIAATALVAAADVPAASGGGIGLLIVIFLGLTVGPEINGRKLSKHHEPVTLTVSETHVATASQSAKGEVTWSQFRRLDRAGDLFLLWFATNPRVMLIPRRAFDTTEDADSFRDFARSHVGARS